MTAAQRHEDLISNQQTQLAIQQTQLANQQSQMANHQTQMANQQSQMANHELLISEIREGQAMLAQYFREALDRFDHNTQLADERHQLLMGEIRDLRQDFLAHMRAYHPPVDR